MSLDSSIEDLRSEFKVPQEKRDKDWAHKVCTYSRFVHLSVWKSCPNRKLVADKIIPLLHKAKDEGLFGLLKSIRLDENDKKSIAKYQRNIRLRIENLQNNYLKGKPSDFPPIDKLDYW